MTISRFFRSGILFMALLGNGPFVALAAPVESSVKIPVKLSFDKVPVVELVNVVFGDILKENYVLHPALVNSDLLVTLQLMEGMDKAQVRRFMVSFLKSVNIAVEERAGYAFLLPLVAKEEGDDEMFFYRPKYRSVSYITDLSASVFKHGKFTTQRGVKSSGSKSSGNASSGSTLPGDGASAQAKAVDNGSNALSVQDKNEMDAFIFSGSVKEIGLLQKLLGQIDTPVGEVLVKGVVYEVTTTSSEGSAFSLAAAILGQRFGVNIGQAVTGADTLSITTPNFPSSL